MFLLIPDKDPSLSLYYAEGFEAKWQASKLACHLITVCLMSSLDPRPNI